MVQQIKDALLSTEAKNIRFGLPLLITLLGSVIWITWYMGTTHADIMHRLKSIEHQLEVKTDDRWRKQDMKFLCIALEALNDEIDFKCPDIQ